MGKINRRQAIHEATVMMGGKTWASGGPTSRILTF